MLAFHARPIVTAAMLRLDVHVLMVMVVLWCPSRRHHSILRAVLCCHVLLMQVDRQCVFAILGSPEALNLFTAQVRGLETACQQFALPIPVAHHFVIVMPAIMEN